MLKEFASPLTLDLVISKLLAYYLMSIHGLAVFAVFYSAIPVTIKFLCFLFISIHFIYQWGRRFLTKKMIWMNANEWLAFDHQGKRDELTLSSVSLLVSWLVILVFKKNDAKKKLVLIPYDSLNKDAFRLLKVRLNILKVKELKDSADHGV